MVIIGGGACGVAAFIDLFIQLKSTGLTHKLDITIVEPDEIGKGLAFGTRQPGHLLNTQADLMGIHAAEPGHYSTWLESNAETVESETIGLDSPSDAYSTRRLYSDYLQEQFEHYHELARSCGAAPAIVHQLAVDIVRENGVWNVILDNGDKIKGTFVLLAPGTPKPDNYPELRGVDEYFDFPWPSEPILERIGKDATVGILGTSLSAIDAIMTLVDNEHRGAIHVYSPEGMLPRVQPKEDPVYQRKFLTEAGIHEIKRTKLRSPGATELFRLFKQEAEHYTGSAIAWKETGRSGKPAKQFLLDDIRIAEAGGDAFINILYSMRHEASTIWKWLSVEEKNKFKYWIGSYWTSNRHCMPLANARRLQKLFETDRLFILPSFKKVEYNAGIRKFVIDHADETDNVDYLINATGPGTKIEQMRSTLIQNLRKSHVIEGYGAGGIKIDPTTMQVVSNNVIQENLYAVGHLCNGMLLDVNAVWYNVKTIAQACEHILTKATGEHHA